MIVPTVALPPASPLTLQVTPPVPLVTVAVSWTLVQGKMLKKLDGTYRLTPTDAGQDGPTEVTYQLEAELNVPMIGMLRRKAEKVIIDSALKGLKKRVESLR